MFFIYFLCIGVLFIRMLWQFNFLKPYIDDYMVCFVKGEVYES